MHPRPNGRPEEHQQARRRVPECANTLLTGSPFPHEHTPQPRTKEHPACGHEPAAWDRCPARRSRVQDAATPPISELGGAAAKNGGRETATVATAAAMTAVAAVPMDGASPANRERKHVSAYKCAPMAPRAEMRTHGRVRAGIPSRASLFSPFKKILRAQFRVWDPSERRAGSHARERTPSRDHLWPPS